MDKEFYKFKLRIGLEDEGIEVGSIIYAPNGRKGIVEEINSIHFIGSDVVEIEGEASLSLLDYK